jgi:transcriptional regulator with XRE-family HTH domain
MTIDLKAVGKRIRQKRVALGLTQAELAEKAGVDATYASQLERATRGMSLEILDRVATVLKARPGALLDGEVGPAKDDPLLREVRDILAGLDAAKRRAILKALRVIASW